MLEYNASIIFFFCPEIPYEFSRNIFVTILGAHIVTHYEKYETQQSHTSLKTVLSFLAHYYTFWVQRIVTETRPIFSSDMVTAQEHSRAHLFMFMYSTKMVISLFDIVSLKTNYLCIKMYFNNIENLLKLMFILWHSFTLPKKICNMQLFFYWRSISRCCAIKSCTYFQSNAEFNKYLLYIILFKLNGGILFNY